MYIVCIPAVLLSVAKFIIMKVSMRQSGPMLYLVNLAHTSTRGSFSVTVKEV